MGEAVPIRLIVVYLTAIASILFALGIVPAMVLALMNRMLPLALLLIGFAVLFGVYAFANLP